jgi:hypothetical protein
MLRIAGRMRRAPARGVPKLDRFADSMQLIGGGIARVAVAGAYWIPLVVVGPLWSSSACGGSGHWWSGGLLPWWWATGGAAFALAPLVAWRVLAPGDPVAAGLWVFAVAALVAGWSFLLVGQLQALKLLAMVRPARWMRGLAVVLVVASPVAGLRISLAVASVAKAPPLTMFALPDVPAMATGPFDAGRGWGVLIFACLFAMWRAHRAAQLWVQQRIRGPRTASSCDG